MADTEGAADALAAGTGAGCGAVWLVFVHAAHNAAAASNATPGILM
ncbi:hypothetical protein [Granulicoccus sp. GXG6511]